VSTTYQPKIRSLCAAADAKEDDIEAEPQVDQRQENPTHDFYLWSSFMGSDTLLHQDNLKSGKE
jgi:hypothetical protein